MSAEERAAERRGLTTMDIVSSVILVVIVIGILSYFTG